MRRTLLRIAIAAILILPIIFAATSPLLQWRSPVYIAAGLAAVLALASLTLQPVLAAGLLPGAKPPMARRLHRITGATILLALVVHIGGLWITSPPDVIDALTFRSPTPFSLWGVIAMLGAIATGAIALRRRKLPPRLWRKLHLALAVLIVATTILHAMLIQGTMEIVTKSALCLLLAYATWRALTRRPFRSKP